MIFETERLYARRLEGSDENPFFELMGNPNVMNPIPRPPLNKNESKLRLEELILLEKTTSTKVWGLCKKVTGEFIGICGLLKNDNNEDEIAYRLSENFWGMGFGTEIAKGLINYGFDKMNAEIITADVNLANEKSLKILIKFFTLQKEFYNAEDGCVDQRYIVSREDWINKINK